MLYIYIITIQAILFYQYLEIFIIQKMQQSQVNRNSKQPGQVNRNSNKRLVSIQKKSRLSDSSTSNHTLKILQTKQHQSDNQRLFNAQLSDIIQIKSIKNDEFIFRMKLKLIACMQQLQIDKSSIQNLRKQQNQIEILHTFINPIKKLFSSLNKIKEDFLMREDDRQSSRFSSKNIQSLEIVSLESQLKDAFQGQRKLKIRCQKLFTQNTDLNQRIKHKQYELEQVSHDLYKTKLQLKEYESVAEGIKSSVKKGQKDFIKEKQRLNEQINALKQLIVRERQAKQIYSSKNEYLETQNFEKQDILKRQRQQVNFLKKQCLKWKNRSEWKENESFDELKQANKTIKHLQEQIQTHTEVMRHKQSQLILARREADNASQILNKKLENIVEQWKQKLIQTVEQYEKSLNQQFQRLQSAQRQQQTSRQAYEQSKVLYERQIQTYNKQHQSISQMLQAVTRQSVEMRQKYKLQTAINDMVTEYKSQNLQLKMALDLKQKKLSQLDRILQQKELEIQAINRQLSHKQTEVNSKQAQNKKGLQFIQRVRQQSSQLFSLNSKLVSDMNKISEENKKISHDKSLLQNDLIQRISLLENKRIMEVSRLKVQNQAKTAKLLKQIQELRVAKENNDKTKQLSKTTEFMHTTEERPILLLPNSQQVNSQPASVLSSSENSVNNSFNQDTNKERNNRFVDPSVQSYSKTGVRRIFVRSSSINEDLKESVTYLDNRSNVLTFKP